MSTPDPTVQLRPYLGGGSREKPVLELRAGRWDASARVTPITLRRRRQYSIDVTWRGGEPMHGFPAMPDEPGPDQDPPERHDMLLVDELELAQALAQAAIDELRAGRASDLRALLRRFR